MSRDRSCSSAASSSGLAPIQRSRTRRGNRGGYGRGPSGGSGAGSHSRLVPASSAPASGLDGFDGEIRAPPKPPAHLENIHVLRVHQRAVPMPPPPSPSPPPKPSAHLENIHVLRVHRRALPTQIRRLRRRRSRSSPRATRTFMFPEFVSAPCPRRVRVPAVPNFANQRYRLYDRCSGKDAISFVHEVGSYWTWARPSKLLPPLSMGPKSF